MTVTESKGLRKGSRVYWRGDATDSGHITEISWDAVTIAWDNGQVAIVHHGTCAKLSDRRQGRPRCKGSGIRAFSSRQPCRPPPQAEADAVNGFHRCRRVLPNKMG
jgi:hypothetical protein